MLILQTKVQVFDLTVVKCGRLQQGQDTLKLFVG